MRDIGSSINAAVDVPPLVRTGNAATNGAGVDMAGYNAVTFLFITGTMTDSSLVCKIQEDDASNFGGATDVAAADVVGGSNSQSFAATDDNVVKELTYIGKKRYVRGVMTQAGATSGGTYGSVAVRGAPLKAPA